MDSSRGSLWREMERRFEAYKSQVVRPFFRKHFARIDRQVVLVDVLGAIHAGPAALEDLRRRLSTWEGGQDAEALQTMVFAVGTDHGFEPLRSWFSTLYEVLLGQSQGPRFGGFIALYGIDNSRRLIAEALA